MLPDGTKIPIILIVTSIVLEFFLVNLPNFEELKVVSKYLPALKENNMVTNSTK